MFRLMMFLGILAMTGMVSGGLGTFIGARYADAKHAVGNSAQALADMAAGDDAGDMELADEALTDSGVMANAETTGETPVAPVEPQPRVQPRAPVAAAPAPGVKETDPEIEALRASLARIEDQLEDERQQSRAERDRNAAERRGWERAAEAFAARPAPARTPEPAPAPARTPQVVEIRMAENTPAEPLPVTDIGMQATRTGVTAPPAPEPPAPAPPEYVEVAVPRGTRVQVRLSNNLSSETARLEELVTGEIAQSVRIGGRTVVPSGSQVRGTVRTIDRGGRLRGASAMAIAFDEIVMPDGSVVEIQTTTFERTGPGEGSRTARNATAGGGAGAFIGGLLGGKRGAAIGAAIGTGGGVAASGRRAPAVEFNRGSVVQVSLTGSTRITVES